MKRTPPLRLSSRRKRRFYPTLESLEARLAPALFTVNTLVDDNDGLADGVVSLREAIQAANLAAGPDTIDFSVVGTAALNQALPAISITGELTIDGPGSGLLTVQYPTQASAQRLLAINAGSKVAIDGLTFKNGNAGFTSGSAIRSLDSKLTLTDCVFTNNSGPSSGGAIQFVGKALSGNTLTATNCVFKNNGNSGADGGAVWAQPFANSDGPDAVSASFTNCVFNNNKASGGGAISFGGGSGSSLFLNNCDFNNNTGPNHGGAIKGGTASNGTLIVADCDFVGNTAGYGAAIDFGMGASSQWTMTNSTFVGNLTAVNGGAVFAGVGGTFNVTGCSFVGNSITAQGGGVGLGGALLAQGGATTVITACTFSNNVGATGGALYTVNPITIQRSTFDHNSAAVMGGAANLANGGTIINCTFSENATNGSGGALIGTGFTIRHSTLTLNRADADGNNTGNGGGIVPGANSVMHNTIVAQNYRGAGSVPEDVSGAFVAGGTSNLIGVNTGLASGLTNGVNGNQIGTAANPINPQLAPLADNGGPTRTHALLSNSPALDAGNNLAVVATTDQRGFPRVADGPDANTLAVVDIGAYETSAFASLIPDQTTPEDTPLGVSFTVGDAAIQEPTFGLTSANPAVLANDAAHLFVTGSGGSYVLHLVPNADQFGPTTINMVITINGQTVTRTFVLQVLPVNDAPMAGNDAFNIGEDQPLDSTPASVLANDSDIDNATLTASLVANAMHGIVNLNADGTFTYQPDLNFSGVDSFTYQASDDSLLSNVATVTLNVAAVNDAPVVNAGPDQAALEGDLVTLIGMVTDPDSPTHILTWSVTKDGNAYAGGAGSSFSFTPDDNGSYVVTLTATDDDGEVGVASKTISVTNVPPTVNAGGNAALNAGDTLTRSGSFADPGADTWTATVDYGDGSGMQPLTLNPGKSFSLSHLYASAGTFVVTVTVVDDDGGSGLGQFQVSVTGGINAAPAINFLTSSSPDCGGAVEGDTVSVAGQFTDPNPGDSHTAIIHWGDGTSSTGVIVEAGGAGTVSGAHVYANGGIYTITVTISDNHGASDSETASAVVAGAGVQNGILYIIGTDDDDHVTVNKQGNGQLKVHADFFPNANFKTFSTAGITKIVAMLCDGDDDITVAGNISIATILDGEAGNDHLNGGGGLNILLGGSGDDMLLGGSDRDVMIGGQGADRIVGNGGDDLLIAGTTAFDEDYLALDAIMAEWASGRDYATRVANLRGTGSGASFASRLNGNYFLNASGAGATVFDDSAPDKLTGSAGRDWFFGNLYGGVIDVLTDLQAAEEFDETN